jgi:hypothetical protein
VNFSGLKSIDTFDMFEMVEECEVKQLLCNSENVEKTTSKRARWELRIGLCVVVKWMTQHVRCKEFGQLRDIETSHSYHWRVFKF